MIVDRDLQYHTPENPQHDWAETYYFDILVPEANIHAWVYVVARAGVGAMVSDVEIVDMRSNDVTDALYVDIQNHVALPARLDAFALSSGLAFEARSPRSYQLRYQGADDTALDLMVDGVMEPYDIHDPEMDPMATPDDPEAAIRNSGFGTGYSNHFDMTARLTGTLRVRGISHKVDCIATMDHSWGPRPERGMNVMAWTNAHFGPDKVMHAIWSFDPFARPGEQHKFKHGYAIVDGRVRGAIGGRLVAQRAGHFVDTAEFVLVDRDGTEHRATGEALNGHLWQPYGCCLTPTSMIRWTSTSGDIGHGTIMEALPLDQVTGRRRRWHGAADNLDAVAPVNESA